jgi:hypothetical protein
MAVDAVGTGTTGVTNGEIGSGVTAFQTEVVMDTRAGARGGTIPTQIGAVSSLGEVGVIHSDTGAEPPLGNDPVRQAGGCRKRNFGAV